MDLETNVDEGEVFDIQKSTVQKERFELLVLSEAGKPIYSFSKREDAVTLMPLCSTLLNYAKKAQKETLISMKTSDNLMISFTTRSPLIVIVIYDTPYVDPQILVEQVEAQIISILTAKTLKSVFDDRPTFDLKRLLYGSEKLIDSVTNLSVFTNKLRVPIYQAFLAVSSSNGSSSQANPKSITTACPLLPSRPHRVLIPVVTMLSSMRDTIHNTICDKVSSNSKNMVFSLLFRVVLANGEEDEMLPTSDEQGSENSSDEEAKSDLMNDVKFKLITCCNHHNRHKLKIADIHILLALLDGSKAQLSSVESLWLPVCLPRFNQDAFLHSYISYTNNMKHCLVMLSVDRDEFTNCHKARNDIEDKLDSFLRDSNQKGKIYYQLSPLVHPVLLELQEKLIGNFLSDDELAETQQQIRIYNSKLEIYHARQLQFLWYQTNKQVFWWQRSPNNPLCPVLYYVTKKMLQSSLKTLWLKLSNNTIFLGWHVPTFQLYAQFDKTITTSEATEVIQRITNWIKKEEDNFSIKDYR